MVRVTAVGRKFAFTRLESCRPSHYAIEWQAIDALLPERGRSRKVSKGRVV